jgi:hypothetical protein
MLTLIFISTPDVAQRLPEALLANFPNVARQPFVDLTGREDERLLVEDGDHWLAARRCDALRNEYDELEMDLILPLFPDPSFVVVEGRGLKLLNQMFLAAEDSLDVLVDNDHGLICPIAEIKRRIADDRIWIYEPS